MIQKVKLIIAGLIISGSLGLTFSMPAIANAVAESGTTGALCTGAGSGIGSVSATTSNKDCGASATGSINNTTSFAINIFSAVVAIIAVIMIIIGGVRYITSGGSSEKTTSAKDTILFAIVGLVIVALAQIIVHFVLHKAHAL
jgi:hypothetical protein